MMLTKPRRIIVADKLHRSKRSNGPVPSRASEPSSVPVPGLDASRSEMSTTTLSAVDAAASAATPAGPTMTTAATPIDTHTYTFCVQLASVLDTVKRMVRDVGVTVAGDACAVRSVAEQCTLDPFAGMVVRVADALHTLHTLGAAVCPVNYFVQRFQVFIAAENVVELRTKQLLSLARRCVLGTRAECLVNYVATSQEVTPMLRCYLHARREDVPVIVGAVGIPEGVIALDRIAPDLETACRDATGDISRMVCPQYHEGWSQCSTALCVPPSLVPCVRRLALLDSAVCRTPLVLVASGAGLHALDLVLETFVDLAVVPGAVRAINLCGPEDGGGNAGGNGGGGNAGGPSPGNAGSWGGPPRQPSQPQDLSPADLMDIDGCIQRGVPVYIRSVSGVPPALAHHPRLRLHVVHVRASALAHHVAAEGGPPLSRASWATQYARRLWDAVVDSPPLDNVPLQAAGWRPAAPSVLHDSTSRASARTDPDTEDVALLSEMLHTGREGLQLCQGAVAPMEEVAHLYAAYRRRRGYFHSSCAAGGISPATLATAACIVNDLWDDGFGMDMLPPAGCVCGIRCTGIDSSSP